MGIVHNTSRAHQEVQHTIGVTSEGLNLALTTAWRTLLFYFVALAVIRLMGKREVGRLSPIDLVVAIMIAEAAVIAVEQPDVPLLAGLVPIVVLFLAELGVSYLSLRYEGFRRLLADKPSVVIRQGQLDLKEMQRQRYNLDDLMEQLRLKGYGSPADVEFAVLETSGDLSVVPKADRRPLQPSDVGLSPEPAGLPAVLIADGHIEQDSLRRIRKNRDWLYSQLSARGIDSPEEVFLGVFLPDGTLYVQRRGKSHPSHDSTEPSADS